MKSLHATKRSPQIFFVFMGVAAVIVATFVSLALQGRTVPVDSISQLFVTNPIPSKPSVTGGISQQPVANLAVASASAVDSAGLAVRQTAVAQSQSVASKVSYPSMQISLAQRNKLLVIALSVSLIGVLLYAMTLLRTTPSTVSVTRRPLYNVIDN